MTKDRKAQQGGGTLRPEAGRGSPLAFCNQIEFHPYLRQAPPIQACRDQGLAIVAYSPLARGGVLKDPRLAAIGKTHGKSPAQVALRWLVQQSGVIAIPKGTRAAHLRENLAVFDFELDDREMASIGAGDHCQRLIDPAVGADLGYVAAACVRRHFVGRQCRSARAENESENMK